MLVYQKVKYDHHLCRTVPYCTLKLLRATHFEYSYMWVLTPNSMDRKTIHNLHLHLLFQLSATHGGLEIMADWDHLPEQRGVLACLMLARNKVCMSDLQRRKQVRNTWQFLTVPRLMWVLWMSQFSWISRSTHDATWCNLEMGSGKNKKKNKKRTTHGVDSRLLKAYV